MILKTNLLKSLTGFLACSFSFSLFADEVDCLRDLIPVTDKVSFHQGRVGFERPFVVSGKFVVFPEVKGSKLTGFFVYSQKSRKYYDAVRANLKSSLAKAKSVSELASGIVYDLVAQPDGLETITVSYTPQLAVESSRTPSGAAFGSSMLPVVGALVELQEKKKTVTVYNDPNKSSQASMFDRKLLQLTTKKMKSAEELLSPLRSELKMRKAWIQQANLDNDSFRELNRILQTSCRSHM